MENLLKWLFCFSFIGCVANRGMTVDRKLEVSNGIQIDGLEKEQMYECEKGVLQSKPCEEKEGNK